VSPPVAPQAAPSFGGRTFPAAGTFQEPTPGAPAPAPSQTQLRKERERAADKDFLDKDAIRMEIQVPAGSGGMIVGKKAAQIQKFRQECGAKVAVKPDHPDGDTSLKVVVIEGSAPNVRSALKMLAETLTMWELNDDRAGKHPKGRDHWTDYVEQQAPADGEMMPARLEGGSEAEAVPATDRSCRLELTIPVAAAGMVVGKQGKTIKNIKLRSGASVWLAPEPLASDPSRKAITLTGSAAQVAAARESVLEVMFGWLRNAPDEEGGGRDATEAHARSLVTEKYSTPRALPAAKKHTPPPPAAKAEEKDLSDKIEIGSVEISAGVTKVEIFVTVAAAAMIIGKKGLMLKLLQTKSKAKIQLDQDAMTDGRKRVVLEGTMEAVHNAQKQVSDIVAACDDSKYEEQAKRRSETEEGKKTAFDTEKKKAATAKATQDSAQREAVREAEREEKRREDDEARVLAKKAKIAADQEEKRKLAAKVAANPFMFLKGSDDEESEEEEEEEEEEVAVKEAAPSGKSKRKKKGRPGLAPAPEPEAPENPRAGVRAAAPGGGGVRSASVVSEESQEEEDASEEDGERKIGLDRLLHTMHAELDPVETARKFGKEETVASQEPALLRLDVGSLSRRGVSHANEDRLAILEFTDLLSEGALAALLLDSRSRSMPFFAVFDGHGGGAVSEMASKQLAGNVASALEEILTAEGQVGKAATEQLPRAFEKGFQDTEEQAVAMHATGDRSGACALAMVMCENGGEYMLHVANLGDCRAIVARRDTNVHPAKIVPVHLTADHRATVQTERSRIEAAGGEVKDKRALGDLIPSRTLGDIKTKNKCPGAVSAAPEMTTHILTEEDSTIIVASDGLWDDMKVPKVMELLLKHPTPDTAAHAIATAVIKKYGAKNTKPNDDLTIIAVNLQWP